MGMYKRVLVSVNRGPMSTTVTAARPWEVAILRAIHGDGAVQEVKEEEAIEEATVKLMLAPEEFVLNDASVAAEYERLCMLYGMHPKVEQPWAEYVYGRFEDGKLTRAIAKCSGPAGLSLDEIPEAPPRPKVKSLEELRDECDTLGIEWTPSMSERVLQAMIDDITDPADGYAAEFAAPARAAA